MENQAQAVELALAGILRSAPFAASARSSAFLRFIVEETLEGRSSRLKAFTIATSVLGRGDAFDPQTNPIVRVEAMRLRKMIEDYYAGEGASDPLQIRVHRGSYVPEFVSREDTVDRLEPKAGLAFPVRAAGAALALLVVGLLGWASVIALRPPPRSFVPGREVTIAVAPVDVASQAAGAQSFADDLVRKIEDALSRFDRPVVVHDDTNGVATDYRLSGSLSDAPDGKMVLAMRVTHVPSHEIVWVQTFDAIASLTEPSRQIASTIAQTYGVVASDMHKRISLNPEAHMLFSCIRLAYSTLAKPDLADHRKARTCLEAAIASDPREATAKSALSYLLTATWLDGIDPHPGEAPLTIALALARDAIEVAPQKARARTAYFWTRFFDKRYEDAFEAAHLAIELNPNASDTLARVGAAMVLRGRMGEGREHLKRARSLSMATTRWIDTFEALAAYSDGDMEHAARRADGRTTSLFPLGLLVRIAVAEQRGEHDRARADRASLMQDHAAFAADLPAALDRYGMIPDLRDRLLVDYARSASPGIPPAH